MTVDEAIQSKKTIIPEVLDGSATDVFIVRSGQDYVSIFFSTVGLIYCFKIGSLIMSF
jgi:hypothetical protein